MSWKKIEKIIFFIKEKMKVYVVIYSSGYEKYDFSTQIPGIFYKKKDAMKRLIELVVKERFYLDRYNEMVVDAEGEDNPCYIISGNEELDSVEDLINGLVHYVGKDINTLIEIAEDSYYKEGWTIRIDEMIVE